MSIETGGPAFPCNQDNIDVCPSDGMTLRDYFATKAMEGALAGGAVDVTEDIIAKWAYGMADAMLKGRKQ